MAELDIVIKAQNQTGGVLGGLKNELSGLGGMAQGVGKSFGGLQSAIGGAFKAAAVAAGAATAAIGAAVVKSTLDFGNFQQGMNEVFTLLPGISQSAMGEMSEQVKSFSLEFKTLPEEIVPSLYQALSAGVPQDNVFEFLEVAQKAALGGVTTLEAAVDAISSTVNAYGADVLSSEQASDMMFTAVRLGKTTFDELGSSLFNVSPTAAALGVNFGDVQAALAAMTAQGVPTSVATTQLRQLLVELSKSGTDVSEAFIAMSGKSFQEFIGEGNNLQDALAVISGGLTQTSSNAGEVAGKTEKITEKLGKLGEQLAVAQMRQSEFNDKTKDSVRLANQQRIDNITGQMADLNAELSGLAVVSSTSTVKMTDLFGSVEAGNAALALTGKGADLFGKAIAEMGGSGGATDKAFGTMDTGINRIMDSFKSFGAVAMLEIGERVSPYINRLGELFSNNLPVIIDFFKQFLDNVVLIVDAVISWDTASLPLLGTLQTIYEQVSNVIGPIAEAIASFVGWKDVIIALGVVAIPIMWGLIAPMLPIIAIAGALIGAVALVRTAWENDWGGIRELVGGVVDSVMGAYQGFMDGTLTLPQAIGSAFAGIGAAISEQLPGWIETLQGWGAAAWQWILDAVPVVLEKLGEWWESIRKYILENRVIWGIELKAWGEAAWQWIVDAIPPMLEKLGDFVGGILGWLADKLPDFIAMIYKWATALVEWIGDAIPKAIDNLTKFISGVGQEGDQTGGSVFGEMVGKWVGTLIDWIINDLIPKVGPAFLQFAGALLLALGKIVISLGALAITLGAAIIDGIVSGINAGASAIWDALMEAVTAAWNGAKEFLGIHSPSTLFADIGRNTMLGMAKGITDNIALPASAALSAMGSMTNNSRLQPAYATGGRSGDNYNIYQQVYGAQPAEVGRASRDGVLEANRRRGR